MSDESEHKLIYMANQIARNLKAQGHDEAVATTFAHIVKFWDPRMKATIVALAAEGAGHFDPIAAAAVARLRAMPARG
jgi:formate dehydrogenase subunit delta